MNKKVGIIVGVIIVLLLGGYGASKLIAGNKADESSKEKVKVTHRYGETEVPKNPERVIVLDNGTLDIMDEIGIDSVVGIAKSSLPSYLKQYDDEKYKSVGSLKEINLETVNELKPDLIIIEGRQESYYEELSKIATTIGLGTVKNDFMASLENNMNVLGEIFVKGDETKSVLADIKAKVEAVAAKIKDKNLNAMTLMVSDGAMNVFGENSRFGTIYKDFGFNLSDKNLTEDNRHGETISYEYILSQNPDYIFVVDRNAVTTGKGSAKEIIETQLVKNTEAYKSGRIIYLDSEAWYVGESGIKAMNKRIADMENAVK